MTANGDLDGAAYEAVLADVWPGIRRAFNYPLVGRVRLASDDGSGAPEAVDAAARSADSERPGGAGYACRPVSRADRPRMGYRWNDDEVVVSGAHLDRLAPADEADLERLLRPLLKHELGHYAYFPRELAHHLRYLERARTTFGEDAGEFCYATYADVCDDLRLLQTRLAGEDLVALRRRTLEAALAADELSPPRREAIRRVQRLFLGLYRTTFPDLPSVVDPTDDEARTLERLGELDYLDDAVGTHERNLVRFGTVLLDHLDDIPGVAPGDLAPPEDEGKAPGERPFAGGDAGRVPDALLDGVLTSTLLEEGKAAYERLLEFLAESAGFSDPLDRDASGGAGLDRADLERNDDQVPFYRRWARGHPVYVADRPLSVDSSGVYRRGRRRYELGIPIHEVNPFASLGLVGVPGVSQADAFDAGETAVERPGVPDLLVGIDSSGSMPDSAGESHAVLAAFVLAETYFRNGVDVGGYNFSADVAFLPPSRDLDALHALLCARWGGGTVLDWAALARFVERMDDLDGVVFSGSADHEAALERLEATGREQEPGPTSGTGRRSSAGDSPEAGEQFATVDHVLVTDGDVANEEEAVAFLEAVAGHARNLLFLTDESRYRAWADLDLPNTWVYAATEPADLVSLAVAQGRRLATGKRGPGEDDGTTGGPERQTPR